jgi:uncharacterized protein
MSALASITVVLAVMLAGILRKAGLDATILAGIVLTGILFGRVGMLGADALATAADYKTVSLMLLVYLVYFLNGILSAAGTMKKMIASLEHAVSDPRITVTSVPALIGLMPVPSGAMISAPFADEIGGRAGIDKERRHMINYWFRHISEYVNPIYPGVLLAASLLGITFYRFFASNLPIMLFYVAAGYLFFAAPMAGGGGRRGRPRLKDAAVLASGAAPILAAVVLPVAFGLDITISLVTAIALAYALNRGAKIDLPRISRESLKLELIFLVYLVMLFKTVLDGSQATARISSELIALGAPPYALLILVPMSVGFLTGLTIGYVGLTFPILMPFLTPSGNPDMGAVTLAFVSGYMGILLSPMHLCFSITQKYFDTDIKKTYRMLLPPLVLTFLWTLLYVSVIR